MDLRRIVAVAAGAMVGATLRWGVVRLLGADGLDAALLTVNVAGCLFLGFVAELPRREASQNAEAFLGAGLCGSLTTWSSLALDTASDLRDGAWLQGSSWLALNLVLGVTSAVTGRSLGRRRTERAAAGARP